jgi:hypothetical protein
MVTIQAINQIVGATGQAGTLRAPLRDRGATAAGAIVRAGTRHPKHPIECAAAVKASQDAKETHQNLLPSEKAATAQVALCSSRIKGPKEEVKEAEEVEEDHPTLGEEEEAERVRF